MKLLSILMINNIRRGKMLALKNITLSGEFRAGYLFPLKNHVVASWFRRVHESTSISAESHHYMLSLSYRTNSFYTHALAVRDKARIRRETRDALNASDTHYAITDISTDAYQVGWCLACASARVLGHGCMHASWITICSSLFPRYRLICP